MKVVPGQVYWNARAGTRAVVYSVQPGLIRSVVVTLEGAPRRLRFRRGFYSIVWKQGVPEYWSLEYNPPKRREACD